MNVTHKITMDLTRPTNGNRINVVEGDKNSRIVNVHLYENSVSWRVPTDASILIKWERESGVGGEYSQLSDGSSAWSAVGNVLTITLSEESTEYSGNVKFSIVLTSGDSQISTFIIVANVHAVANGREEANSGTSSSDISKLQKKIGNLSDLETKDKSSLVAAINEVASSDGSQNVNGLSAAEKNLMLALFKAVPYTSDVSATMKSLDAIWNSGAGGDEGGDAPGVTYYAVTYNLTDVTADNSPASIIEGGSLTVNLTPDTNAVLGGLTVTMGGVDVTATVYSNGKISISSVTGDVVITAVANVAKYTQVEYLESASATAYMVTPCTLRPTDTIECVWANMQGGTWAFPFGAYGNSVHCSLTTRPDNVAGRTAYTRRSGANYANKNTADASFVMPETSAMYRFTESTPGTGTIYDADGNALVTLTDENASGYSGDGTVLGLFYIINAQNQQSPYMHGTGTVGLRMYSFKITDVYGVATLDLIPVLDADNVPCMYDKVSGEYLYDASGENAFTAGGAV